MLLPGFLKEKSQETKLKTSDLRQLAPFRDASEQNLGFMLQACKPVQVTAGAWQPEISDDFLYFLKEGQVHLTAPNGQPVALAHDDLLANYPLPVTQEQVIRFDTNGSTLLIPKRFLALANSAGQKPADDQMEVTETGDEGEIYIELYTSLKAGKCDLPSMPDIAIRIGRAIDNPNTLSEDIAKLIQLDPALTARIMGVVNSAAFGAAHKINSLQVAVSRLGRKQIRNLVYSMVLKNLFYTESKFLKQRIKDLWTHSCHVAAISFILARNTEGLDPDHAMLAGLVHDIGILPILSTARNYPDIEENPKILDDLIASMRGDIGAMALSQWGLDADLVNVARNAEDWFHIGTALPGYLDIVLIAQLHAAVGTQQMQTLPRINEIPAFEKISKGKLDPKASLDILNKAGDEIAEVRSLLGGI